MGEYPQYKTEIYLDLFIYSHSLYLFICSVVCYWQYLVDLYKSFLIQTFRKNQMNRNKLFLCTPFIIPTEVLSIFSLLKNEQELTFEMFFDYQNQINLQNYYYWLMNSLERHIKSPTDKITKVVYSNVFPANIQKYLQRKKLQSALSNSRQKENAQGITQPSFQNPEKTSSSFSNLILQRSNIPLSKKRNNQKGKKNYIEANFITTRTMTISPHQNKKNLALEKFKKSKRHKSSLSDWRNLYQKASNIVPLHPDGKVKTTKNLQVSIFQPQRILEFRKTGKSVINVKQKEKEEKHFSRTFQNLKSLSKTFLKEENLFQLCQNTIDKNRGDLEGRNYSSYCLIFEKENCVKNNMKNGQLNERCTVSGQKVSLYQKYSINKRRNNSQPKKKLDHPKKQVNPQQGIGKNSKLNSRLADAQSKIIHIDSKYERSPNLKYFKANHNKVQIGIKTFERSAKKQKLLKITPKNSNPKKLSQKHYLDNEAR